MKQKIMTFEKAFDIVSKMREVAPEMTVGFEIYPSGQICFFGRMDSGVKKNE